MLFAWNQILSLMHNWVDWYDSQRTLLVLKDIETKLVFFFLTFVTDWTQRCNFYENMIIVAMTTDYWLEFSDEMLHDCTCTSPFLSKLKFI